MAREVSGPAPDRGAAWFALRAEDRDAAALALHALRHRAARLVAVRCRCGIAIAEDHVAEATFVMVYGIRRAPRLRISATTTLAYLCGGARNEWRWHRWRRARQPMRRLSWRISVLVSGRSSPGSLVHRGAGMTLSAFTPAMASDSARSSRSLVPSPHDEDPYTKRRAGILVPVLVPVGDRIPP